MMPGAETAAGYPAPRPRLRPPSGLAGGTMLPPSLAVRQTDCVPTLLLFLANLRDNLAQWASPGSSERLPAGSHVGVGRSDSFIQGDQSAGDQRGGYAVRRAPRVIAVFWLHPAPIAPRARYTSLRSPTCAISRARSASDSGYR